MTATRTLRRSGRISAGGPLVTGDGRVLAVASLHYAPLGYAGGAVGFAPAISAACGQLLHCR